MKLPRGFLISGVRCGIKKKGEDLALVYSEKPATSAAVFTENLIKAAPVIVSKKNIRRYFCRAVLINSGNANAATGDVGLRDCQKIVAEVARCLNISPAEVLVASTGIIGQRLPTEKIISAIPEAKKSLGNTSKNITRAVAAIMTTDTFPKYIWRKFSIGRKEINIFGFVKGAGMIAPKLTPSATMICCILTDLNISKKLLQASLNWAVSSSFNRISIDGDTSPNDTVFLLANGLAGNKLLTAKNFNFYRWRKELTVLCQTLAKKIVQDGEGTKHLLEIVVEGLRNKKDAQKIARAVGDSLLVKTAIFGNDPNWGRILAAIGKSEVKLNPKKIDIAFQVGKKKIFVYKQGKIARYSPAQVSKLIRKTAFPVKSVAEVIPLTIRINLHQGKENSLYYTGDLSYDYVRINASYHT